MGDQQPSKASMYRKSATFGSAMRPETPNTVRNRSARVDGLPVAHTVHLYAANPQGATKRRCDGFSVHSAVEMRPTPDTEYLKNGPAYSRYGYGYPYNPECFIPRHHAYEALSNNMGDMYAPCHKGLYPQVRHAAAAGAHGQPMMTHADRMNANGGAIGNHCGMSHSSRFHDHPVDCRKAAGGHNTMSGGGFNGGYHCSANRYI